MSDELFRLEINVPGQDYDKMLGLLALETQYGWEEKTAASGVTVFTLYGENMAHMQSLANVCRQGCPTATVRLTQTANRDWLEAWKEFFTPVQCGTRFVILPPWLQGLDFAGRVKIVIEPKCAFGTGHHASTSLCLTALGDLLDKGRIRPGQTFLDLGCGSGVLGIAAVKSGLCGLGLDTDPLAIANALENREINAAACLELAEGSIEDTGKRKFDFIIANIMAGPLIEMAPEICSHLAPGGCLVLGGILDRQATQVEEAYARAGMGPDERMADGEWRALIWA